MLSEVFGIPGADYLPALALTGGLVLGLLAATWSKVKLVTARLISYVWVSARVEDHVQFALLALLWDEKRFRRSRLGDRRFESVIDFVGPVGRHQVVGFESAGGSPLVFWRRWRPLFVRRPTDEKGSGGNNLYSVLQVSFLRGTFDIEALLIEALDHYNALAQTGAEHGRYTVRRLHGRRGMRGSAVMWSGDGPGPAGVEPTAVAAEKGSGMSAKNPDRRLLRWLPSEIGQPREDEPFAALAYPPEVEAVAADVRRWRASEAWYKAKRIPWRRGYLLCGKPGTGKSALVRALAQELDLPIDSYDLASFTNADFEAAWQKTLSGAPRIALFEDLDAVFRMRENVTSTSDDPGLTFDCFLQVIGGVADAQGVLVFVTSNHPDLLDPALASPPGAGGTDASVTSRPGRIDRIVEVGVPDRSCRRKILERILVGYPDAVGPLLERTEGMTGAQVVELATEEALTRYWSLPNHDPDRENPLWQTPPSRTQPSRNGSSTTTSPSHS